MRKICTIKEGFGPVRDDLGDFDNSIGLPASDPVGSKEVMYVPLGPR